MGSWSMILRMQELSLECSCEPVFGHIFVITCCLEAIRIISHLV